MSARVAVIVPCFNDGATLREALGSIDEQEPVELLVIDDGSSDPATLALFEQLRAEGVRVLCRENGGLSAARMSGVAATSAPYVFPLDSDDALMPGALAAMADALEAGPRAGFAYGDYEVFGEYRGLQRSPARFDPWAMTYANFIPVSSLIRRSALLQAGGWELPAVEDWDLWLKMAEIGWDGVHVPQVIYRHRVHGERLISDTQRRHGEMVAGLRARHPELFGSRRQLAARSRPGLRRRVLYPLAYGARDRKLVPLALHAFLLRQSLERSARRARSAELKCDAGA